MGDELDELRMCLSYQIVRLHTPGRNIYIYTLIWWKQPAPKQYQTTQSKRNAYYREKEGGIFFTQNKYNPSKQGTTLCCSHQTALKPAKCLQLCWLAWSQIRRHRSECFRPKALRLCLNSCAKNSRYSTIVSLVQKWLRDRGLAMYNQLSSSFALGQGKLRMSSICSMFGYIYICIF